MPGGKMNYMLSQRMSPKSNRGTAIQEILSNNHAENTDNTRLSLRKNENALVYSVTTTPFTNCR